MSKLFESKPLNKVEYPKHVEVQSIKKSLLRLIRHTVKKCVGNIVETDLRSGVSFAVRRYVAETVASAIDCEVKPMNTGFVIIGTHKNIPVSIKLAVNEVKTQSGYLGVDLGPSVGLLDKRVPDELHAVLNIKFMFNGTVAEIIKSEHQVIDISKISLKKGVSIRRNGHVYLKKHTYTSTNSFLRDTKIMLEKHKGRVLKTTKRHIKDTKYFSMMFQKALDLQQA